MYAPNRFEARNFNLFPDYLCAYGVHPVADIVICFSGM